MKNILQRAFPIITLAGCFTLTGCFKNFYTVKSDTSYQNLGAAAKDPEKKVIIHYTDETVALQSPEFDADQITGNMVHYFPAKPGYAEPREGKKLQPYKYMHRETLFKEVHVYANIPRPYSTNIATIKKEQVIKYNTYKPAKGASIGSHVLGGVLIACAIGGIAIAAAAASMTIAVF